MRDHKGRELVPLYAVVVNGAYQCTSGGVAFRPTTFDTRQEAEDQAAFVRANSTYGEGAYVIEIRPIFEGEARGEDYDWKVQLERRVNDLAVRTRALESIAGTKEPERIVPSPAPASESVGQRKRIMAILSRLRDAKEPSEAITLAQAADAILAKYHITERTP